MILGKRDFLINRRPCSAHMGLIRQVGLHVEHALQKERREGIGRAELAPEWKNLVDDDLYCASLFVQATRPM